MLSYARGFAPCIPAPGGKTISGAAIASRKTIGTAEGCRFRHSVKLSQVVGGAGTPGQAPFRHRKPPGNQCRRRSWGCKGRSPLHKKTMVLPLPRWGRGSGGWGQGSRTRAGQTGEAGRRYPAGHRKPQGEPETPGHSPRRKKVNTAAQDIYKYPLAKMFRLWYSIGCDSGDCRKAEPPQ